jgi:hypothetical protein
MLSICSRNALSLVTKLTGARVACYSSQNSSNNNSSVPSKNDQQINKKSKVQQTETPTQEEGGFVNPKTGEIGGPKGLEPTRYGILLLFFLHKCKQSIS